SGQIHRKAGRLAEAQKAFTRALENDPRSVEALTSLVNLELGQKRRDAAIAAVNTQIAKAPDSAGLQLIAGRTFAVTGDLARSEAALRKAIELDPSLLEAYHVLGQVFVRAKKLDQAVRAYQDRLTERPSDVAALTMIGMIQIVEGKQNEARSNFEKVLSIDPRAAVAANNLAYMDAEAGTNLDVA